MKKINLRSYDDATRYITEECLAIYAEHDEIELARLVFHLLAYPKLPLHCPQHHYLIPAALLTATYKLQNRSIEELSSALMEAMLRAKNVLPAFCGLYGSCGTAVGLGIYVSILHDSDQYSRKPWALANAIVGQCLTEISKIDGPRCCKRNSYLALQVGESFSRDRLGLDLGNTDFISCNFYHKNLQDCQKQQCPFYPLKD